MKILVITVWTLFLSLAFSSLSQASTDQNKSQAEILTELTEQNHRVLSGRVYKILEARLSNMSSCSAETKAQFRKEFTALPIYSEKRSKVLETLDLYLKSYNTASSECRKSLDRGEQIFHGAERKKFWMVGNVIKAFCPPLNHSASNSAASASTTSTAVSPDRNCAFQMHQFFADLDPHCVSSQVPNAANLHDPFPCMAADYLVGKTLVSDKTWKSFLYRTQDFLENTRTALLNPEARTQGVDLWRIYLQDNPDRPELRELFLAEMNFYFSSFHSNSSYIRGFHDHIWSFILFKTTSAEQALDYFMGSRLIVDQFRTLSKWAAKNKVPFTAQGLALSGKNRHDYMAANLACHYRDQSRVFHRTLPVLLGYAYETLDFKSHVIDDKDSWAIAKKNFKVDTHRYRDGASWGYRFCKMHF